MYKKNIYELYSRAGETTLASDPNSINVGGDIKMNLDLNEAIREDVKLSEQSNWTSFYVSVNENFFFIEDRSLCGRINVIMYFTGLKYCSLWHIYKK